MSLLYRWKPGKDRVLAPVGHALFTAGITPNMVTAAGLLVSTVAGLIAASGQLRPAIVVFVIGAGFDLLDGSLARITGSVSEFGRYLDSVCDRLSETVFVVGAIIGGISPLAITVIAGSLLLLVSRVHNHRKGLGSDAAVFSRPERLALLIAGMLAPLPASELLFIANACLCVVSSYLVLRSGPRWHER